MNYIIIKVEFHQNLPSEMESSQDSPLFGKINAESPAFGCRVILHTHPLKTLLGLELEEDIVAETAKTQYKLLLKRLEEDEQIERWLRGL